MTRTIDVDELLERVRSCVFLNPINKQRKCYNAALATVISTINELAIDEKPSSPSQGKLKVCPECARIATESTKRCACGRPFIEE